MKHLINKKRIFALLTCLVLLLGSACSSNEKDDFSGDLNTIQVMFSNEEKTTPIELGNVINVKEVIEVNGETHEIANINWTGDNIQITNEETFSAEIDKNLIGAKQGDTFEGPFISYTTDPKTGEQVSETGTMKITITKVFHLRKVDDELVRLFVEYQKRLDNANEDLLDKIKSVADLEKYLKNNPLN